MFSCARGWGMPLWYKQTSGLLFLFSSDPVTLLLLHHPKRPEVCSWVGKKERLAGVHVGRCVLYIFKLEVKPEIEQNRIPVAHWF